MVLACSIDDVCLEWAYRYLRDCVCSTRDEISLALGLLSVFSWGVAEVPQIITNFRERSTEGISLAFLMTWVLGDVFNLAGCYLEPITLPTQFYTALLYTITTVVLVGQTVYYGYLTFYFHPELKYDSGEDASEKPAKPSDVEESKPRPSKEEDSNALSSQRAINVPHSRRSSSKDLYYMSARSLASSHTPTVGSFLVGSRESGSHTQSFLRPAGQGTAAQDGTITGSESISSNSGGSLARTAAASILLVGSVGLTSNMLMYGGSSSEVGQALRTGRRLLQTRGSFFPIFPKRSYFGEAQSEGPWGEILGWFMAAIYMGGRLPQIVLNIRRGTVEGLNPLMFIFALVGNATYVGSILVRSMDWLQIKPNMPWLVDAGVCVLLDFFIICQFVYYTYLCSSKLVDSEDDESKKGSYEAIR